MYFLIPVVIIAIMSIISFILYAVDKKKAERGAWRISERTLLLSSFFFGAIGSYPAMYIFHHKTQKMRFHIVNIMGILLSIIFIVAMLYFDGYLA